MSNKKQPELKALKEIQELCAKFYKGKHKGGEIIQDIWRTANFAVIDAEKAAK